MFLRRLFSAAAASSRSVLSELPAHKFQPDALQNALDKLPYFVSRTSLGKSLPVYVDYKHGGSKVITIIRKIYGSPEALAEELTAILPNRTSIRVRPEMQQIVVDGLHLDIIKAFLTHKGF